MRYIYTCPQYKSYACEFLSEYESSLFNFRKKHKMAPLALVLKSVFGICLDSSPVSCVCCQQCGSCFQQTPDARSTPGQCWADVKDVTPTLCIIFDHMREAQQAHNLHIPLQHVDLQPNVNMLASHLERLAPIAHLVRLWLLTRRYRV